ncbi:hypothetical protein ACQPZA_21860 [Pseudonocardia xinjiangensis]|uniref:hypothetical protein n=1 Tax=Pseudonocardia xinjiangensis TaxID=75289 RepID=UPI003D945EFD
MSMLKVFAGFVPWIVFSLVATRTGTGAVATAGFLAFLVAAAFILRSVLRGESPKVLEVTGAVAFAGIAVASLVDPRADAFLAAYGRSIATWTLAVVIFAMLPIMPFTEQYARESVPKEFWHTERFRSVNRRISAAWGVAIASTGVGHLVASLLRSAEPGTTVPSRPLDLVFNWVLPIALIWWAVRYTNRLSKRPDDTTRPGPGHPAERPSGRTA